MTGVIVYKTAYGATRTYAQWLGEELSLPVHEAGAAAIDAAKSAKVVIAGGSVYAGRLNIAPWLKRAWPSIAAKRLAVFTVAGEDAKNAAERNKVIAMNLPAHIAGAAQVFHFDGKMNFAELRVLHRMMIDLFSRISKDPQLRSIKASGYDRVSKNQIAPLVAWVKAA